LGAAFEDSCHSDPYPFRTGIMDISRIAGGKPQLVEFGFECFAVERL
jgi:hypothetical protein